METAVLVSFSKTQSVLSWACIFTNRVQVLSEMDTVILFAGVSANLGFGPIFRELGRGDFGLR